MNHDPPEHHRRDFLKGRAAASSLVRLADRLLPPVEEIPTAPPRPETGLVAWKRRAMACDFEVLLNAGQYPHAIAASVHALDLVDQLEGQLSVYRDDSEVMRLNRQAAAEPIAVEAGLFELLCLAQRLYLETGGAYDITTGALTKAWGFHARQGVVPSDEELAAARARSGGDALELDLTERTVRFLRPGLELNLGSIGKGYALDRMAEALAGEGIADFFCHGGQSSVRAGGSRFEGQVEAGWRVGVRHPLRPERRIAEIRLCEQALGTSGSGTQFFRRQGRRFGHILDPRSGQPAEAVLQATVVAPQAALADALSTAFYVLGPAAAAEYGARHPEIAALIVRHGPRPGDVVVDAHGFAPDTLRLEDE